MPGRSTLSPAVEVGSPRRTDSNRLGWMRSQQLIDIAFCRAGRANDRVGCLIPFHSPIPTARRTAPASQRVQRVENFFGCGSVPAATIRQTVATDTLSIADTSLTVM